MRREWPPRSDYSTNNASGDTAVRPSAVLDKKRRSTSLASRSQVGAQSVSSAMSHRSRRSAMSVAKALEKVKKLRGVKVKVDEDAVSIPAEETTVFTETTLIRVAPRVMSGVLFERSSSSTFYEDNILIAEPENDTPDAGYIRFVEPLTTDLIKSLPLVDSPNQTSAHEEGVEVSRKCKVIAWSEEAALEVSLPTSDKYTIVVEIGIIHNDKMCPLGMATLRGKSGEEPSKKTQMVVRPQPQPTTTKYNAFFIFIGHQRDDYCSNYQLGQDSALTLEMEIIKESALLQAAESPKTERASTPSGTRGILDNFAARFGTHGAILKPRGEGENDATETPINTPSTDNKGSSCVVSDEPSIVCSARSTVNTKNTNSPVHELKKARLGNWESAGEGVDPNNEETCEQRLPFDEMTEYSDGGQTRESYPEALESQNCYMFAGDLVVLPSSSSSSSESTNQESSCEGSVLSCDSGITGDAASSPASIARSLEDIMQKRERGRKAAPHPLDTLKLKRDKKLQLESTEKSKNDSTTSTNSSSPRSSDTSRTARLKKSIKESLKRVLEFNNRGIKKTPNRKEIDGNGSVEGQGNSILDEDSMTALTSKDAKWTTQASLSQDFVDQVTSCCSPFPSESNITDDHAISLSPRKVSKLAVALKVSPSKLIRAMELIDK